MNLNDLNREQRLAAETLEGPLSGACGRGIGQDPRADLSRGASAGARRARRGRLWRSPSPTRRRRRCGSALKTLAGAAGGATCGSRTFHSVLRAHSAPRHREAGLHALSSPSTMRTTSMSVAEGRAQGAEHRRQGDLPPREIVRASHFRCEEPHALARTNGSRRTRATTIRKSARITTSIRRYERTRCKSYNALDFDDLLRQDAGAAGGAAAGAGGLSAQASVYPCRRVSGYQPRAIHARAPAGGARAEISASSATTINPSTAGAARISETFSILRRIFRTRRSSSWSRITAPPANILDAANQVIALNAKAARTKRCGRSRGPAN